MFALAGIILIGVGLFRLLFADAVRGWNAFTNSLEGHKTEHNDTYEFGRIAGGILAIVGGLILILIQLAQ